MGPIWIKALVIGDLVIGDLKARIREEVRFLIKVAEKVYCAR
jgi:hypothetical protein